VPHLLIRPSSATAVAVDAVIPRKGTVIVHSEELVRSWRQPGSRRGQSLDHPSGEITLRTGGRLVRRQVLLAPSMDVTIPLTLTQSCPLTPEPELLGS
jgi:hypothetical protein